MKVAILIPTYARIRFLQEALHCALRQDYPATVIILNDCPDQRLECDHPNVIAINEVPLPTLGRKRNRMLHIAMALSLDRVCWLDDDDLCFPNYVSGLVTAAQGKPCVGECAWSYYKQDDMPKPEWKEMLWPNEMLVDPALLWNRGGYPHLDSGEDQVGRSRITDHDHARSTNRAYIYRWGQGSFHVSGAGDPLGGVGFRADAQSRLASGQEPSGRIELVPKLHHDYGF